MTPAAPPSPAALAWAHRLDPDGVGVAFAIHDDQVLVAPTVLELVEGVWHAHPDQAHKLLRTRIHTTRSACELDHAIVQLCSRKLCADVRTDRPGPASLPVNDVTMAAQASRAHHAALSAVAPPTPTGSPPSSPPWPSTDLSLPAPARSSPSSSTPTAASSTPPATPTAPIACTTQR